MSVDAAGRRGTAGLRRVLGVVLVSVWAVVAADRLAAQPPAGSQLDPEDNACATCHGETELWEGDQLRLFVARDDMAEDVHFRKGVNCHDCHGGDPATYDVPEAHATDVDEERSGATPFRFPLGEVEKSCVVCHRSERLGVADGVHARAGEKSEGGQLVPLACQECHGEVKHRLLPAGDARSPVFLDNQVRLCGGCHERALTTYEQSVHGHGLVKSGLLVTAVCADCHGAHGIYAASNERSSLYPSEVAATCAKCHRYIRERLQESVHGGQGGPGTDTLRSAPGGHLKRKPSCTDCHRGHDPTRPQSPGFRLRLANRCGDCHTTPSTEYAISMHGSLTELGYAPAAGCSDCHGSHDVLPVDDPDSMLSAGNRLQTCERCHPESARNYLDFDPHADHRDARRDPVLYWVYVVLISLLIYTFSFFALHSLLWFVRGLVDVFRHGRPKRLAAGSVAYVRFQPFHKVAHAVMAVSFLGLALTGLPLKFSHCQWAQTLAGALGGFESIGTWHRLFGAANLGCLALYMFRTLRAMIAAPRAGASRTRLIFGPDSLVPNLRDLKDFLRMLRWFVGLGPKPTFERWAYWEKYDFWGASADIAIIGLTGMILWFPNLACAYFSGQLLNIAKVIHSTQALLATGFVFAIHFFNAHLRPEKFPMDMSVLTGMVSEEELREERPEYYERMRRSGELDQFRITVPARGRFVVAVIGGLVAVIVGVCLLAGMLLDIFGG